MLFTCLRNRNIEKGQIWIVLLTVMYFCAKTKSSLVCAVDIESGSADDVDSADQVNYKSKRGESGAIEF